MSALSLFKRTPPPSFPEARVGFAVGDIHGRADLLAPMLAQLEQRADDETRAGGAPIVVFMGDYVDRGPQSAEVIDMLLSGRPWGYERRHLKGNHEQSMLAFMASPLENRAWVLQGGAETMRAYGVEPPPPVRAAEGDWLGAAEALRVRVPQAHQDFLAGLETSIVLGGYVFVHAGVDLSKPLERQSEDDLLWSRERFINSGRRFSHCVVHGHTPVHRPTADRRRVNVDTGAYATGVLTAARFEGAEVSFIDVTGAR